MRRGSGDVVAYSLLVLIVLAASIISAALIYEQGRDTLEEMDPVRLVAARVMVVEGMRPIVVAYLTGGEPGVPYTVCLVDPDPASKTLNDLGCAGYTPPVNPRTVELLFNGSVTVVDSGSTRDWIVVVKYQGEVVDTVVPKVEVLG